MSEIANVPPGQAAPKDMPQIKPAASYFIVDKETGKVVERLSTSGKRVLRTEEPLGIKLIPAFRDKEAAEDHEGIIREKSRLTDRDMVKGIEEGRFVVRSQEEIIAETEKSRCGIGITGGGDCAGISDFLASFYQHLDPNLSMFGVKNAGKGLSSQPEEFDNKLIIVEGLAAKDFEGMSSTPFGSARVDPLKEDKIENTKENIDGYKYFYGTGGNDHLAVLEKIAKQFPDLTVVGTFKSIDGDGWVNGKPAQMLGFRTAVIDYQKAIWAAAANAYTHNQWHVIETFGRGAGKLAYEAARSDPLNYDGIDAEERRKIREHHDAVMVLVPEKPTTFRSLAEQAKSIKEREGNVVVVAAEGFMPPELKYEMDRLAKNTELKERWIRRELNVEDIPGLIEVDDDNDPRADLRQMLKDRELAAQFGKSVWESKLDDHGNVAKLAGISNFIIQALHKLAGAEKVNKLMENYEARGANPCEYDRVMGKKVGKKMAELVNAGVKGGKAVIYFEGMDPLKEDPVVVDLVGVSDRNNLNNRGLYPEEQLQRNGVFWRREDLGGYLKVA